jgi:toxin ParE1/3/4
MMRLIYLPAALADLKAIALFIAEDNPDRAASFVDELRRKATDIVERPASYPARDELSLGLRAARLGRYLIFFRTATDEVQIVRVLHGARNLPRLFDT